MKYPLSFFCCSSLMVLGLSTLPVSAQIAPDGSLPTSVTSGDGLNFTIDNGTLSGGNLFHSFRDFSVPTNGSAFFNNGLDVQNIFSRVTGGNISNIDGLLRANGGANLFLLNPAGIVFGPNASLNLGGSFFGTTAESIVFADGTEFSTTNPSASPLLTVSVPIGLQMGQNPGDIAVKGTGHNVTRIGFSLLELGNTSPGFQVNPGNALTLVGGNIFLDGGVLTANAGKVELAALHSGEWTLGQGNSLGTLDSNSTSQLGDIQLRAASLVNVSGLVSGAVQMVGQNLRLQDGSIVMGQNFGEQPGRDFQIIGRESITLSGTTPNVSSRIVTQSLGLGNGGNIQVSAPHISISDGSTIASHTFGAASSGNLTVHAPRTLTISGVSPFDISNLSALATSTFSTGDAGTVTVFTDTLTVRGGGNISSATLSSGNGGLVTVNASSLVDVADQGPLGSSAIASISFGSGNAGDLVVNVPRLKLTEYGAVSSSGFASGNAGNILVRASESIEIFNSQLPDLTLPPELTPGTHITSGIYIYPPDLRQLLGLPDVSTGNAGTVRIETPNLTLTNAGKVTVSNVGTGQGGFIDLHADRISLNNHAQISAATTSGEGGNINLQVENLQLRNNSAITTSAGGTGNGGNITIDSPTIVGLENSDIIANAFQGNGGKIQINTQGIFGLENRPQRTNESDITASSQFGVNGTITITNPEVDPSSGIVNFSQEPIDPGEQVVSGCQWTADSEFVATGRSGVPANPNRPLASSRTWSDVRDLSEFRGETVEEASVPTDTPEQLVEATGWVVREDGTVELVANALRPQSGSFAPSDCDPFRHSEAAH